MKHCNMKCSVKLHDVSRMLCGKQSVDMFALESFMEKQSQMGAQGPHILSPPSDIRMSIGLKHCNLQCSVKLEDVTEILHEKHSVNIERFMEKRSQMFQDLVNLKNELLDEDCLDIEGVVNSTRNDATDVISGLDEHCMCPACDEQFPNYISLEQHMTTHTIKLLNQHVIQRDKCNEDDPGFEDQRNLKRLTIMHTGEKQYKCKKCDKSYTRKNTLLVHQKLHTSMKIKTHAKNSYKCKICNKIFTNIDGCLSHEREHVKRYSCNVCSYRTGRQSELIIHQRRHTREKPYQCKSCNKAFIRISNLRRHTIIHTGSKIYSCKLCSYHTGRKDELVVHERRHTGQKPYQCDSCDKAFADRRNLQRHYVIHTGEKKYKCVCGKSFTRKSTLEKLHRCVKIDKHAKSSYQCKICMKIFTKLDSCRRHEKREHVKIYSCNVCSYHTGRKLELTIHQRKHTGEKPYQCDSCGKAFTRKSDMKKHVKLHTR